METDVLAQRAARFREAILEVATGPGGMINSFPRFDNRRPFQEGDFPEKWCWNHGYAAWNGHIASPKPTRAESWYGENTLWTEGFFMWSQMLRYKATGDLEALETARKCFLDLHNIFRLSAMIEPGCLGKPHGGRPGITTSFDQSANPVLFYAWYTREYATGKLKDEAIENLRQHGLWFLRRNMVVNHHGHLCNCVAQAHPSSMKYLAAMYASYELSGEKDVKDTVVTYLQKIVDAGILPFNVDPYEINHNLFYWASLCEYWSQTDLAGMTDWISYIKDYWKVAQAVLDDEGLVLQGNYDFKTEKFTPLKDEIIHYTMGGVEEKRFSSATSYPNRGLNTTGCAYLGLLAQHYGFDDNADKLSKKMLLRFEEEHLGWWWKEAYIPEELKPLLNIFAPEVAAMWQVAYWYGRLEGAWK